jgi:hypothetical protein
MKEGSETMLWEDEKEEKKEALDSWIGLTEEELGFAEAIYEILENSTAKEEFIRLAKAKLREYKNPWIHFNIKI